MNTFRIFCLTLLMACFGLDGYAQEVESATTKQSSSETQPTKKTKKSKKEKQPIQHEWVDLGLPSGLKWATCNVGASSPEDYGDYFAWGETEKKKKYEESNYSIHGKRPSELMTMGIINSDGTLTPSYDSAQAKWGGNWRIPTKVEWEELMDKCKWTYSSINGKPGFEVTGPNGKSIFLPYTGVNVGQMYDKIGRAGHYLTATSNKKGGTFYLYLNFGKDEPHISWNLGSYGRSVRPVTE